MKSFLLILAFISYALIGYSQKMPDEMKISPDGTQLTVGGNQTTGFYDDRTFEVIELEFESAGFWNELDDFSIGSLTYKGITYDSVVVNFKGATSDFQNNTQKKSFGIALDSFINQDIEGYQTLNLNGGFQDPTFMREVLYNWLGRDYNPSLKSNFVHLFINGQDWGSYANVQQLNNDFVGEWFLNRDGTRWRAQGESDEGPGGGGGGPGGGNNDPYNLDCPRVMGGPGGGGGGGWTGGGSSLNYIGNDSLDYQDNYTLKGSDRNDPWGDLINAIDKLNNLPMDQLSDSLWQYFDIDRTLWFLAHEIILVDDDSYVHKGRNDYYVYFDDATEKLMPLEYDGNTVMGMEDWDIDRRIDDHCFPLINRLLQVPEFRQRYLAHVRTILDVHLDENEINERIDMYFNLIENVRQSDQAGNQLFSYQQFLNGIEELKEFTPFRKEDLYNNPEINRPFLEISDVGYLVNGALDIVPTENDNVTINATISNGAVQNVMLYYADGFMGTFTKTEMFDDGMHDDLAANDGIYGGEIPAYEKGAFVRYYIEAIMADGNETRSYMPKGAEHDVFLYQVETGAFVPGDVVINELMASNDNTVADQDGEYDDWIELFNTADIPADLSGFFLTDNSTNPTKYEFPEGTLIPEQGYLIIWADEDGSQDGLHANFKLSSSGEEVYLINSQGEINDVVSFDQQTTDMSYARQPNGFGNFVIKPPTFNANNDTTSGIENENSVSNIKLYPNPANDVVYINYDSSSSKDEQLSVYNIFGIEIYTKPSNGKHQIDVSEWSKGMYFVKIDQEIIKLVIQ